MTKEVIKRLREDLELNKNISDEEIIKLCTGSYSEAIINIRIAKEKFIKALKDVAPKIIKALKHE